MKKIAMILVMVMTLALFGCGPKEPAQTGESQYVGQSGVQTNPREENRQTNPSAEPWGVETNRFVSASNVRVYISFPDRPGTARATGLMTKQTDNTIAAFDYYVEEISPKIDDIRDMFPAYGNQMMRMFEDAYGRHYKDSSIEVGLHGIETIGDYEVTKFQGIHHYFEDEKECNRQFVIYAVELHVGGSYAYVMVQDNSQEQSMLELIESHAYNMILSMREE